jgi:ankyrin repeat protein
MNNTNNIKETRYDNIDINIDMLDKQTLHNCAYEAIVNNHDNIINLLLDRSIISIDTMLWNRTTLLHSATKYGHIHTIKLLLNRGANLHSKDNDNETAFIIATTSQSIRNNNNRKHIMNLLLENGANIEDHMSYQNYTALEWWGKHLEDYEMKEWLISKSANQDLLKPRVVNNFNGLLETDF